MARKYESAVIVTGDASGAVKAIELTDDHLRQLNARQQRNQKTTSDWSAKWDTAASTMKGAALGLTALTGGLVAMGVRQTNAVVQTDRQAKALGIATGQLQAMQYAAGSVGIEQDKMGDILKDVSDKIGDAYANGGGEALDVINNLGLSVEKLVKMSPDQQLIAIGSALDKFQTRAERINAIEALANDASLLLPLLEKNAQGLKEWQRRAYDLNIALPEGDINTYLRAYSAVYELQGATQGLFNTIIAGIADSDLTPLQQSFSDLRDTVTDPQFQQSLVAIAQALVKIANWGAHGLEEFTTLGNQIGTVAAHISGYSDEVMELQEKLQRLESMKSGSFLSRAGLFNFGTGFDAYMSNSDIDEAIEHIKGQLRDLGAASDDVSGQNQKLSSTAIGVANSLGAEQSAAQATVTTYADRQKALADQTAASQALKEAEREHAQALKESADTYARLYAAIDPAGAAQAEYEATLADLQVELREGTKTQLEYYAAVEQASAVYNSAANEADQYAQRTQSLLEQYDGTYRRSQELDQAQRDLTERYKAGEISLGEYQRSMRAVGEEAKGLARDSGGATEVFTSAWDDALDRVDEQFADTFTGVFDGTLSGFSDFADGLKEAFSRLLGELAYAAARNQIVVGLGLDGGVTASGSGGIVSSLFGGGSGSGGGLSTQNLISGGRQAYGLLGSSGTASGGLYGNAVTSGGLYGNVATHATGASWTSLAGTAALGYGVGSFASPYVNDLLGISGGGTGSTFGQLGGAAAGTYIGTAMGGMAGPIGAAIGSVAGSAIGGALDDLFGSDRVPKFKIWQGDANASTVNYEQGGYTNTSFGRVGFLESLDASADDVQSTLDNIKQLDDALASAMSDEQLATIRKDFSAGIKFRDKELTDVLVERYQRVVDDTLATASDAGKQLLSGIGQLNEDDLEEQIQTFGSALQLTRLIDGLADHVRGYAEDVVAQTNGDLQETFDRLNTEIGNFIDVEAIADSLSLRFDDTADNAVSAANALVTLAGSMDTLQSQSNAFYQAFYSQGERRARSIDELNGSLDDLGLSVDSSLAQYRALVEAQDLNTAAGRETYQTLMSVSGSFADLNSSLKDARQQIEQTYQSVLGRGADQPGLDYWMGRYEQGTSLDDITAALGNSVEAMDLQRIDDFADSLSGLIDGFDELTSAQDAAYQARKQQIESERQIVTSLADSLNAFMLDDNSTLNPAERMTELQREYQQALRAAQSSNATRQQVDDYIAIRDRYRDEASSYYASTDQYATLEARLQADTEDTLDVQKRSLNSLGSLEVLQEQQLNAQRQQAQTLVEQLNQQVGMLSGIDSMGQLIAALPDDLARSIAGMTAAAGVSLGTGSGGSSAGHVAENGVFTDTAGFDSTEQQINDLYQQYLGRNADEAGLAYYADELRKGESISDLRDRINWDAEHGAFAKGGVFTNAIVSEPTWFNYGRDQLGVMGEAGPEAVVPLVMGPDGMGIKNYGARTSSPGSDTELRALRGEVAHLRQAMAEMVTQQSQTNGHLAEGNRDRKGVLKAGRQSAQRLKTPTRVS